MAITGEWQARHELAFSAIRISDIHSYKNNIYLFYTYSNRNHIRLLHCCVALRCFLSPVECVRTRSWIQYTQPCKYYTLVALIMRDNMRWTHTGGDVIRMGYETNNTIENVYCAWVIAYVHRSWRHRFVCVAGDVFISLFRLSHHHQLITYDAYASVGCCQHFISRYLMNVSFGLLIRRRPCRFRSRNSF